MHGIAMAETNGRPVEGLRDTADCTLLGRGLRFGTHWVQVWVEGSGSSVQGVGSRVEERLLPFERSADVGRASGFEAVDKVLSLVSSAMPTGRDTSLFAIATPRQSALRGSGFRGVSCGGS